MKCPKCGIEMTKKNAVEWECRNPKCVRYQGGKKNGKAEG